MGKEGAVTYVINVLGLIDINNGKRLMKSSFCSSGHAVSTAAYVMGVSRNNWTHKTGNMDMDLSFGLACQVGVLKEQMELLGDHLAAIFSSLNHSNSDLTKLK